MNIITYAETTNVIMPTIYYLVTILTFVVDSPTTNVEMSFEHLSLQPP